MVVVVVVVVVVVASSGVGSGSTSGSFYRGIEIEYAVISAAVSAVIEYDIRRSLSSDIGSYYYYTTTTITTLTTTATATNVILRVHHVV